MEKTKLIHNIEHTTWNKLSGEAKSRGVKVGHLLTDILNERYEEVKR